MEYLLLKVKNITQPIKAKRNLKKHRRKKLRAAEFLRTE